MLENLIVIRTLAELNSLKDYLENKEFIALDTETTGVDKGSEIIGYSLCADVEVGYYVITAYWDVPSSSLVYLETKDASADFMRALEGKSLIMQNGGFDCAMIEDNYGVKLMPSVHTDTLVLGHLLNENRSNGLKERGVELYGEDARAEQLAMKDSVHRNGGQLTKDCYELYKADADLIAKYGAKDAILTLKIFYNDVPQLYEQGLEKFFYEDETMPLLRGPTYQMNRTGLRVDPDKLQLLKQQLQADCLEAKGFIDKEIFSHVKDKYKGTSSATTFNIGASGQRSWLLFIRLNQEFSNLTDEGRELCKALDIKLPYSPGAKRDFIRTITDRKDQVYCEAKWNPKTKKMGKPKKIRDPQHYLACGKETLALYAEKYQWVAKFLEYSKNLKILNTYVEGIQERAKYNIINPNFLQHGTTSGRYSCKNPNFQNLPRDDKRVKACIVSRPGKVFVGADYSQLEPRVFASISQDERLLRCFADGDDFYSVIGADVFNKTDCSLKKDDSPSSFPVKYKKLRDVSKVIALATPYGTTPFQMGRKMGKSTEEASTIISNYLENYPGVAAMMLDYHKQAKDKGEVRNLFGRPRRMPKAMEFNRIYGNASHSDLPYEARNTLNLAVNHPIQSTGASIMNRAAIAVYNACRTLETTDPTWADVKIVTQIHDELILEAPAHLSEEVSLVLKSCMENTSRLPGVDLIAEPKIANNLKDLK